ncbi:MAG: CHAT domain-containing protein [Actinomycetota bacterium]
MDAAKPLRLHVLHGSLLFASYPVLVGHYRGDPIAGAEGYLDRCLGWRLSNRQVLDRYPSEIGDVVRLTNDRERPPGALVVGLGARGELTASGLARAVRNAALEHVLRWTERPDPRTLVPGATDEIGLSSVLIGTYGLASLTLPASVAALVEGVALANDALAKGGATKARVGALEVVELYATPAEEAAHVVRDIERLLPASLRSTVTLLPEGRLRPGEGRRPARWGAEYGAGMWRRLIVSGTRPDRDGQMVLEITSLGAQAGADRLTQVVDTRLVGSMLSDAVQRPAADHRVNTALFELLFPNELKRELANAENVQLVLDEHTADFPWEALTDRGSFDGARPLARRAGLLRQLRLDLGRRVEAPSGTPSALVVGDPPGGPGFARLAGARREATTVAELLAGAGMPVIKLVYGEEPAGAGAGAGEAVAPAPEAGPEILSCLYSTDHQIVHIAAHGYFRDRGDKRPLGGVVIGPDQYLTAAMFSTLRRPPDIVFLNCCHLASVGAAVVDEPSQPAADAFARRRANQLAASVSRALMVTGVKAVVAAGWSVADMAAEQFARTFYENMLAGATYGDAVRLARDAAFEADGGASNTWAAYQCYGDPGFRLVSRHTRQDTSPAFVSADELVRALDDVAVSGGEAEGEYAEALAKTLEGYRAHAQRGWPEDAEVLCALGRAYGQLNLLDQAVAAYRKALACGDATLPIKAVERLANYEHRLAMALLAEGQEQAPGLDALASVEDLRRVAGERLEVLDLLGPTAARHNYRGGWHKREALLAPTADETRALLSAAARDYLAGWRLSRPAPGQRDPYGAYNALQLVALGAELEAADMAELVECLEADPPPGQAFFARAAAGNQALTRLVRGELEGGPAEVADCYRQVFAVRSSPAERHTVVRHVRELLHLAERAGSPTAAPLQSLVELLPAA